MKHFIPLCILSLIFVSCTKEVGFGGQSTIEGYVYSVYVYDDLKRDTSIACKEDVYILFTDSTVLDKVVTGPTGKYKYQYLNEGRYTLCAYTKIPDNNYNKPVMTSVKVSGNDHTYKADTLYIQDGKSIGMTYLTGTIMVNFYNKNTNESVDKVPDFDQVKVYLRNTLDETSLTKEDTDEQGRFAFPRLAPGNYKLSVAYEYQNQTVSAKTFDIVISNDYTITFDDELKDGHDIGTITTRVNI